MLLVIVKFFGFSPPHSPATSVSLSMLRSTYIPLQVVISLDPKLHTRSHVSLLVFVWTFTLMLINSFFCTGRVVRIQAVSGQVLQLAEVEVYGPANGGRGYPNRGGRSSSKSNSWLGSSDRYCFERSILMTDLINFKSWKFAMLLPSKLLKSDLNNSWNNS